VTVTT
jgi:hypothetical protein